MVQTPLNQVNREKNQYFFIAFVLFQLLLSVSSVLRSRAANDLLISQQQAEAQAGVEGATGAPVGTIFGVGALSGALPVYTCIKGRPRLVQLHSYVNGSLDDSGEADSSDSAEHQQQQQQQPQKLQQLSSVESNGRQKATELTESGVTASSASMEYYLPPADEQSTSVASEPNVSAHGSVVTSAGPIGHVELRSPQGLYLVPDKKVMRASLTASPSFLIHFLHFGRSSSPVPFTNSAANSKSGGRFGACSHRAHFCSTRRPRAPPPRAPL